MGPDERAIRGVHSAWIEAVNSGDLACLLSLMADDVVFVNPGREPLGRDGFAPGFSAAHQHARIGCDSELEEVVVSGDVAYTRSRDSLSVTPLGGGGATQLAGHRMTVYRKQPDGRWLLARDAHTLIRYERPGQLHPNEFEVALLERLASEHPDARIVLADLHVLERTYTGVGSFTEFLVKGQPSVPRRVLQSSAVAKIPGLQRGLGIVAFREGDRLTLETFAYGDEMWDGAFEGFTLETAAKSRAAMDGPREGRSG
jgi:uncharacterized protein (TIGR02246 family)